MVLQTIDDVNPSESFQLHRCRPFIFWCVVRFL